ncbi:MAG: hypothetical protein WDA00_02175 [Eubacteriales bacterium]
MHKQAPSPLLIALSVICCLSVAMMIYALITATHETPFSPPEFDRTALVGTPEVPQALGYSRLQVEQGFQAYVCGNLLADGRQVDVYFTSPETNTVWLLLRLLDEQGRVLGETGIIRPGEYVKAVTLHAAPDGEQNLQLKIVAYQPETYVSMGTVGLHTTLKIGGQE